MTNREWLETLTDEEFAKWHLSAGCKSCANNPEKDFCNCCIDGTVKWLQEEHKEK